MRETRNNSRLGEREFLLSIFKVISKSFLLGDKNSLKHVLKVIKKTDFPKETEYSKVLLHLKKAVKAGIQQDRYDVLSQYEKVKKHLKNERDAWKLISEELSKIGEEKLADIAKAWFFKCEVYLSEGKSEDVVKGAYSASQLFKESGEDELSALFFADVLTREIFGPFLWQKYQFTGLLSFPEFVPRFILYELTELTEARFRELTREHMNTLLKMVSKKNEIVSLKALMVLRKVVVRADDDQTHETVQRLSEKWKMKSDLHALTRENIVKTLSSVYPLVNYRMKKKVTLIISEALADEDSRVLKSGISFLHKFFSELDSDFQILITQKVIELFSNFDNSVKENWLSLISSVDFRVLLFDEEGRAHVVDKIKFIGSLVEKHFKEAKLEGESIDIELRSLPEVLEKLGVFFDSLRNEERTLEFYEYAITARLILEYLSPLDSLVYKVASAYAKNRQWQKLAEFWLKIARIRVKKEKFEGAAFVLRNAANCFMRMKEKDQAANLAKKIVNIAEKQVEAGKHWSAAICYKTAAEIYVSLKSSNQALRLIQKIEAISENAGILALQKIVEIYIALGMPEKTTFILRKMMDHSKTLKKVDIRTSSMITEGATDILDLHFDDSEGVFEDLEKRMRSQAQRLNYGYKVPENMWETFKSDQRFSATTDWLKKIADLMVELDNDRAVKEVAEELVSMAAGEKQSGNPIEWDKQQAFCAAAGLYRHLGENERAAKCYEKAGSIFSQLGEWNFSRITSPQTSSHIYLDAREKEKARMKPDRKLSGRNYLLWIDKANQAFTRLCRETGLSSPIVISKILDPSVWAAICYENAAHCFKEAANDYMSIGLRESAFDCYEHALRYNSMCHREGCFSGEAEIASLFERHSQASRLYSLLAEQATTDHEKWKIKYYSGLSAIEEGEESVLRGERLRATRQIKKGIRLLDDAKKIARQEVMLSQISACRFRSTYAKARLKVEQGFIERERNEEYEQAIRRFKQAEVLFKKLQKSELTNQEKTLVNAYEMFARAHKSITNSIALKKQNRLTEAKVAVEEAINIFSDLSDIFRRTMRKKSEEWINGVVSCLNAMVAGQRNEGETRVLSFFVNARLSLSKVIGEKSVEKMSNNEVSRKLLGSMAFPLPAPMCRRPDLIEKSVKLDVFGEIPSEVTEGEAIDVQVIVRIEKTQMGIPESLPLRLVIEQSGKRAVYPGESGTLVSTRRYLVKHLSLLFDRPGNDLIRIVVEYVGRGPGCFFPLYKLTKRYKVKVQPHEVSSLGMLGKAETSPEPRAPYLQILDEIRETKMLIEKLSSKVATKDDLKETEKLLVDNQRKLQAMLSENMGDLKRTLGKDLEKRIGKKKANRFWQLLEKVATISDLVDFAKHVKDLLSFLHEQKIVHMALPVVLKMLL